MPSGVCSIKLRSSLEVVFFLMVYRFDFFHEINREYVGMFLHPIGVSLIELFNLISDAWLRSCSVSGDVSRCVDNDSEIFVLKLL